MVMKWTQPYTAWSMNLWKPSVTPLVSEKEIEDSEFIQANEVIQKIMEDVKNGKIPKPKQ